MEERYLLKKDELDDIKKILFRLEAEHKRDNIQNREHLIEGFLLSRCLCAIGEEYRASFLDQHIRKGDENE